jgi:hypothetical protein
MIWQNRFLRNKRRLRKQMFDKVVGVIVVNVKMTKVGTRMVLVLSVGTGLKGAWIA